MGFRYDTHVLLFKQLIKFAVHIRRNINENKIHK
jgi:hypothetical protein